MDETEDGTELVSVLRTALETESAVDEQFGANREGGFIGGTFLFTSA